MQRNTLIDFYRDLAEIQGEFLVYDDGYRRRGHSYEAVGRAARAFAAKLVAAGFAKGDKVVFWGENRPEWVVCYWGCLLAGIIAVPIDYRSSVDFVLRVRTVVGARLILIGDDVTGLPPDERSFDLVWRLADLDWRADAPMPDRAISRDDIIQIIFTSGATAEPKGVVIRHRNVLANIVPVEREVMKYRKYARPFHPLRFVNLLPLSHMFGQSMASSIPPMVRGTVIFTRSFNPARRPAADQDAPRVGARLRAEDPRCASRACRARLSRSRRGPTPGHLDSRRGGGSTAACTPRSA